MEALSGKVHQPTQEYVEKGSSSFPSPSPTPKIIPDLKLSSQKEIKTNKENEKNKYLITNQLWRRSDRSLRRQGREGVPDGEKGAFQC